MNEKLYVGEWSKQLDNDVPAVVSSAMFILREAIPHMKDEEPISEVLKKLEKLETRWEKDENVTRGIGVLRKVCEQRLETLRLPDPKDKKTPKPPAGRAEKTGKQVA